MGFSSLPGGRMVISDISKKSLQLTVMAIFEQHAWAWTCYISPGWGYYCHWSSTLVCIYPILYCNITAIHIHGIQITSRQVQDVHMQHAMHKGEQVCWRKVDSWRHLRFKSHILPHTDAPSTVHNCNVNNASVRDLERTFHSHVFAASKGTGIIVTSMSVWPSVLKCICFSFIKVRWAHFAM